MDHKSTSKKPVSPYKYVLFDMDGVLINSLELWIEVGLIGLKEHNIEATREDMVKAIVKFTSLSKFNIPDLLVFGERINALFCERCLETTLQENVIEVLEELRRAKIGCSVITTSGRVAVDDVLKNLAIRDYFDYVTTFEDVKKHKPDPEGIITIMKKYKAAPEEVLIVGDTRNDIVAGKAAGITTVMFYPPHHEDIYDKDHLLALNADYYIRDLRALLTIMGTREGIQE